MQRNVLYLGEINDSQRAAWSDLIEAFDEGAQRHTQLALFPADQPTIRQKLLQILSDLEEGVH